MAEIHHLSWSTVDGMLTCPKKFQLRKVVHVEERPSYAAIGGSAVHAATEQYDLHHFRAGFTVPQEQS